MKNTSVFLPLFFVFLLFYSCQEDPELSKSLPMDGVTLNATSSGDIWLEAECANAVGAAWEQISDTQASNGSSLRVKDGNNSTTSAPTSIDAWLTFTFNSANAGAYYFYTRVTAPSAGSDSFWFRFNSGAWQNSYGVETTVFAWKKIQNTHSLIAGENTLEIAYREDGLVLDKIYLGIADTAPSGTGSPAINCGPPPSNEAWLEAECANPVGTAWEQISDTQVSNGSYLKVKAGNVSTTSAPTDANAKLTFTFSLANAGAYYFFARVLAPDNSSDSFWYRFNGGSWLNSNGIGTLSFAWKKINNTHSLPAGQNTLEIAYRESHTAIDKLHLGLNNVAPSSLGLSATNCGQTPGNIVPAMQVLKEWNFNGSNLADTANGLYYHHLGRKDGSIQSVTGATDGKAGKFFVEPNGKPFDDDNGLDPDELYHRMELYAAGLPTPDHFHRGSAKTNFSYLNREYIYQFRYKLSSNWQKDTNAEIGADQNTSLFEFKQDYYPSGDINRERDATFRLRITKNTYNFIFRATSESFAEAPRDSNGNIEQPGVAQVQSIDASADFNVWRLWTVHAKWSSSSTNNGFIRIYRDNELVYQRENTYTAYDDEVWLGPYMKFGLYDARFKYVQDTGSDYKELFVDYVKVGIPQ